MSHKRNEALRHVQHSMHHVIAAGEGSDRAPDSCKLCPYYRPDFKFRTCLYAHCPYKKQVNVFRSTPEKWDISNTDPIYSDENDWMSKRTQLEEYFSQSLEVELLLRLCPDDEDTIYQIVDLLVDTCSTKRKMLRIAGDDKPAEVVRSRFMKLNADHIRFVLKCLAENSSPIRNMKQYLLASLYNAPTTMQLSYQNQTNHDLAMRR